MSSGGSSERERMLASVRSAELHDKVYDIFLEHNNGSIFRFVTTQAEA